MKKYLFIVLLFVGLSGTAQELTWHTDLTVATDLSIKNKKPLLLFFTGSDWCGWCIKLQKDVLKTKEFAAWANENVTLVELDFPRNKPMDEKIRLQNAQLQQTFKIQGYPTVWIVEPTKDKENKVSLNGLGSLGYDKSAANWIETATKFLPVKVEETNTKSTKKSK